MFYGLTHEELQGKRPLAKFLSIKLIVMFTFYQSFVVSRILVTLCSFLNWLLSSSSQHWREGLFTVCTWKSWIYLLVEVEYDIVGNQFWTATNIADGLTAFTTCIEVKYIIYFENLLNPTLLISFPNLDGLVCYLDVVGLHTQGIRSKGRITPNEYLETSLGFVSIFKKFLAVSITDYPFFSLVMPANQDQYLSVSLAFLFWQMTAKIKYRWFHWGNYKLSTFLCRLYPGQAFHEKPSWRRQRELWRGFWRSNYERTTVTG